MNIYDRRRRICEDNHIPYYGPTQEDIDEADNWGEMQYDMQRQQELDDQQSQEEGK